MEKISYLQALDSYKDVDAKLQKMSAVERQAYLQGKQKEFETYNQYGATLETFKRNKDAYVAPERAAADTAIQQTKDSRDKLVSALSVTPVDQRALLNDFEKVRYLKGTEYADKIKEARDKLEATCSPEQKELVKAFAEKLDVSEQASAKLREKREAFDTANPTLGNVGLAREKAFQASEDLKAAKFLLSLTPEQRSMMKWHADLDIKKAAQKDNPAELQALEDAQKKVDEFFDNSLSSLQKKLMPDSLRQRVEGTPQQAAPSVPETQTDAPAVATPAPEPSITVTPLPPQTEAPAKPTVPLLAAEQQASYLKLLVPDEKDPQKAMEKFAKDKGIDPKDTQKINEALLNGVKGSPEAKAYVEKMQRDIDAGKKISKEDAVTLQWILKGNNADMPISLRKDGTMDGIVGPETKTATRLVANDLGVVPARVRPAADVHAGADAGSLFNPDYMDPRLRMDGGDFSTLPIPAGVGFKVDGRTDVLGRRGIDAGIDLSGIFAQVGAPPIALDGGGMGLGAPASAVEGGSRPVESVVRVKPAGNGFSA